MIPIRSVEEFKERFLSKDKGKSLEESIRSTAKEIIDDIRTNGEMALRKYVQKFDGKIPTKWEVTPFERKQAWEEVAPETIQALQKAAENIRSFHQKQLESSRMLTMNDQMVAGQLVVPIEKVGVYVPGGKACYPSTVLMNAIPAKTAGVSEIIMVTPARNEDKIAPILIVAADIAGVDYIYKIGGVQAIAALAYGTENIPKVDKIVGPGNAYVAAAKSLVYGDVGIDMIAGPSEVAIIADETANPAFIAADMLAQAEHDQDARTFLFTTSKEMIEMTQIELEKQWATLPRQEIARESLVNQSCMVVVENDNQAFQLVNQLAPEHLEIQLGNPFSYLGKVRNAGSVFLGGYTPEALGDYFAGPNHVLPTSGTARFSSGLSVDHFIKKTTYLYYSKEALQAAAPYIEELAKREELDGHARAVTVRLGS